MDSTFMIINRWIMMDCMCTMNTGWMMDCMWPLNNGYRMNGMANKGVILDIELKMMVWMNEGFVCKWDNGWDDE